MLSTVEIALYAAVLFLIPIVAFSLAKGSPPPEKGWLARYYRAEKYLNLCGNLFLLSIIATAVAKLCLHFGYIDASSAGRVELMTSIPFMVLLVTFLGLWIRAALKVHRQDKTST